MLTPFPNRWFEIPTMLRGGIGSFLAPGCQGSLICVARHTFRSDWIPWLAQRLIIPARRLMPTGLGVWCDPPNPEEAQPFALAQYRMLSFPISLLVPHAAPKTSVDENGVPCAPRHPLSIIFQRASDSDELAWSGSRLLAKLKHPELVGRRPFLSFAPPWSLHHGCYP